MSIRMIQVVVPKRHDVELRDAMADRPAGASWTSEAQGDMLQAWILVRSEEAERVADRLVDMFGAVEGFRIVQAPVLTSIPRVEETAGANGEGEADEGKAQRAYARVSRHELLENIEASIKINRVYLSMVSLSAVVAAIGLVRDNVAVVIGAMVIAPLLGPNIALGLATTLGYDSLLRRAIRANLLGLGLALLISLTLPIFVTVDPSVSELNSRTQVNLTDITLALASGAAGALAFTTAAPAALVGVMVAVALMPPTVAIGLFAGIGEFHLARGAATLLAVNVICVNLAAVVTFLLQGISPANWWEKGKARRATHRAIFAWSLMLLLLVLMLVSTKGEAPA